MKRESKETGRAGEQAKLVGEAKNRLKRVGGEGARAARKETEDKSLVHELQVHQIELEMQNEELRATLVDLQKAKDKYSELFEFLPIGIFTVNARGVIDDANLAAGALVGEARSLLINKNVRSLISEEDLVAFEHFFQHVVETETEHTVEVKLVPRDKPALRVQIAGVSMQADTSAGKGFYLTMTDVTERAEIEKVRRLADIGELATTVAHELRNPLAAITVVAANIRRRSEGGVFEGYAATIDKKVREGDRIIDNLLFYSRLRSPQFEKVQLRGVLDEVAGELADKKAKGKAFTVEWNGDSVNDVFIEADPLQLKELLMNVVNNAYDAIPSGGTVMIAAEAEAPDYLLIRIRDDGVGIATCDLQKIWWPFYSTKSKGTGLGLSVVDQIVKLHGGTARAKSEQGKGTTVTIRLPLRQTGNRKDDAATPA